MANCKLRNANCKLQIGVGVGVATMKKVTSIRRYHILRQNDGQLLATAETKWAFVNFATGRPARIPRRISQAFRVVDTKGVSPIF